MDRHKTVSFLYITGVSEDAHICINNKKGYEFDIETKCYPWIVKIRSIVEELTNRHDKIKITRHKNYYRIRFWNKKLVSLIIAIKNDPEKVLHLRDKEYRIIWLRGVYDAEGSYTITGSKQPMISIYNNRYALINTIKTIIEKDLKIKTHLYKSPSRRTFQLYITGRDNISRFIKKVNPLNPCKLISIELD